MISREEATVLSRRIMRGDANQSEAKLLAAYVSLHENVEVDPLLDAVSTRSTLDGPLSPEEFRERNEVPASTGRDRVGSRLEVTNQVGVELLVVQFDDSSSDLRLAVTDEGGGRVALRSLDEDQAAALAAFIQLYLKGA